MLVTVVETKVSLRRALARTRSSDKDVPASAAPAADQDQLAAAYPTDGSGEAFSTLLYSMFFP